VIHTTHYNAIKTRVHEIFDDPDKNDPIAHHIQKILALVVLVNTLAIILLTVPAISVSYDFFLSPLINLCLLFGIMSIIISLLMKKGDAVISI
jgi:hypothetical protein